MFPGRVPVALLELIFLRIEILLAAGKRRIFAKLESAVDAVDARERRRQDGANHERGPPAFLQDGTAEYPACW